MKFKVTTIMAIIFIVIMMGSTIAYTFIQAYQLGLGPGQTQTQVKLPDTNIIDSGLSNEQEQLALSQGKTLMKYSYSSTCISCLSLVNQLEGVANQFKTQVILENLVTQSPNQTAVLTFTSQQNSNTYSNPTTDNVIDGMCSVFITPPIECTLRKLNTT